MILLSVITVDVGRSPRPAVEDGSPSIPSGSSMRVPIIWYPPHMPKMVLPLSCALIIASAMPEPAQISHVIDGGFTAGQDRDFASVDVGRSRGVVDVD